MSQNRKLQAQVSYNAGIVSDYFTPRVDMDGITRAMSVCDNFMPRTYGSLKRRMGTRVRYVSDVPFRLIRFGSSSTREFLIAVLAQQDESQPYALVFDSTDIEAGPVASLNKIPRPANIPAPDHRPYAADELQGIDSASMNDVMIFTHVNHCPVQITHYYNPDGTSGFRWQMVDYMYPPLSDVTIDPYGGLIADDKNAYPHYFARINGNAWVIESATQYDTGNYWFSPNDYGSIFYLDINKRCSESDIRTETYRETTLYNVPLNSESTSSVTDGSWQRVFRVFYQMPFVLTDANLGVNPQWDLLYYIDPPAGTKRNYIVNLSSVNRVYVTSQGYPQVDENSFYYNHVSTSSSRMELEPFRMRDIGAYQRPRFQNHLWIPPLDAQNVDNVNQLQKHNWYLIDNLNRLQIARIRPAAWSNSLGWPRCVCFRNGRVWYAGTKRQPQTIWASEADNFNNFLPGSNADSPIDITLGSDKTQEIQWLSSGRTLVIGTDAAEWTLTENTGDNPVPNVSQQSSYGSYMIKAETIGESVLYVTRDRKGLKTAIYDFGVDGYVSDDLTVIAGEIAEGGFVAATAQRDPEPNWWGVTETGNLVGLVYNRQHQVSAWHRHLFKGGRVLDITAYKPPGQRYESLALCIERNGRYYLETLDERDDCLDMRFDLRLDAPVTVTDYTVTCSDDSNRPGHILAGYAIDNPDIPIHAYADGKPVAHRFTRNDDTSAITFLNVAGATLFQIGVEVESEMITLPMGNPGDISPLAFETQIDGFTYELHWESPYAAAVPITGYFAALNYAADYGYAANQTRYDPQNWNNGRGYLSVGSSKSKDTRLQIKFTDNKKINILSTVITYTQSNVQH